MGNSREIVLTEAATLLGARPVVFDAADPAAVEAALAELPDRVDVLVNNAGGNTDFLDGEGEGLAGFAAAFERNLRSNVVSAALVTRITIGSIAAHTGAGSYGAAKAAVEAGNVSVAREFGPRGAFLARPAAGHVTAQVVHVNGGAHPGG